jgi:cell division septation protein DedD
VVKLDHHISELLYEHECVIVPELGGFLSSYTAAHIQHSRHTVMPPSKKIAFNVFLRHHDGLLANHLVQARSVSYPEALREIEAYVTACNSALASGKKFVIEHVGILTRDSETNIQFEPFNNVNYLKDSFGLSPVQFTPVLNNDFEQEVEKQLRDFISLRPSQAPDRPQFFRKKIRLNAMNTMLLAGSILWLCLNIYIVSPGKISMASLNPFSSEAPAESSAVPAADTKPEIYTQPSVAKTETVYVKSTAPVSDSEKIRSKPTVKLEDALGKKINSPSFFIIAGAFSSIVNATKKEAELKAQGYAEASIIENEQGLKLVCYGGFTTREEAYEELNRMKALHKEGWIFPR